MIVRGGRDITRNLADIEGLWDSFTDTVSAVGSGIARGAQAVGGTAANLVTGGVSAVGGGVSAVGRGSWGGIKSAAELASEGVHAVGSGAWGGIKAVGSGVEAVGSGSWDLAKKYALPLAKYSLLPVIGAPLGLIKLGGTVKGMFGGKGGGAAATQAAAADVAEELGMGPFRPGGYAGGVLAPSYTSTAAAGSGDVGTVRRQLSAGDPQAAADVAAAAMQSAGPGGFAGLPTFAKIAIIGGGALTVGFLGWKLLRRRGGGPTKS